LTKIKTAKDEGGP